MVQIVLLEEYFDLSFQSVVLFLLAFSINLYSLTKINSGCDRSISIFFPHIITKHKIDLRKIDFMVGVNNHVTHDQKYSNPVEN